MLTGNMKSTIIVFILLFFSAIFFTGCPNENPDLVNPPSKAETVLVRVFNLADPNNPISLSLDKVEETDPTHYGSVSKAIHPPSDSAHLFIKSQGQEKFAQTRIVKYARNLNYTYFALPSPDGSPSFRLIDTLIVVTSFSVYEQSTDAYIKMINAYPDTTATYSLKLGCPSGNTIISSLNYRKASGRTNIPRDSAAVTIIKTQNGQNEPVGTYRLNLDSAGQYILILYKNVEGKESVKIMDMHDESVNAVSDVEQIYEENFITGLRIINISSKNITIKNSAGETIADDIAPDYISDYKLISACGLTADNLTAFYSGTNDTASSSVTSFEVLKRYSVLIYDTPEKDAGGMMIIKPVLLEEALNGRSMVRVVHAAVDEKNVLVSLGARTDPDDKTLNYNSGVILAKDLSIGGISKELVVQSGPAPLVILANYGQKGLQHCALGNFGIDQKYLVVLSSEESSRDRVAVISEDDEALSVEYLPRGVFTQIVNAVDSDEKALINLSGENGIQLENAGFFFTGSMATVVNDGQNTITTNGKVKDFEAEVFKNALIVLAGDFNDPDIFFYSTDPMGATYTDSRRRFINASKKHTAIRIEIPGDEGNEILIDRLDYGQVSDPIVETIQQRGESFLVVNPETSDLIHTLSDISLIFGKNYSLIFSSDSTLINQEEY